MQNVYVVNTGAYVVVDGKVHHLGSMTKTVGYYSNVDTAVSTINSLKNKFGATWEIVNDELLDIGYEFAESVKYNNKNTGDKLVRKFWIKSYPLDKELP